MGKFTDNVGKAARSIYNGADRAGEAYRKLPVAAQVGHAVLSPFTGVPAALAAHRRQIASGARRFGSGIANLGKRAIGGVAGAFRR
jgi:hypothetical protein